MQLNCSYNKNSDFPEGVSGWMFRAAEFDKVSYKLRFVSIGYLCENCEKLTWLAGKPPSFNRRYLSFIHGCSWDIVMLVCRGISIEALTAPVGWKITGLCTFIFPETNINIAPEFMDGWNTFSFPFWAFGLFSGANLLLVLGRVCHL